MAKVKVTYVNLNGDAPVTTQYGIEFHDGKPVEIDTDAMPAAALALHKWRGNPFFEVVGGDEIVHVPPAPKQVDPRELDPEEVEYAELVKADAAALKKQNELQAALLAKSAEQMKAAAKTQQAQPTPQHRHYTPRK